MNCIFNCRKALRQIGSGYVKPPKTYMTNTYQMVRFYPNDIFIIYYWYV